MADKYCEKCNRPFTTKGVYCRECINGIVERVNKRLSGYCGDPKDDESSFIDFMTDLRHWAASKKDMRAFDDVVECSKMHYLSESGVEDGK